MINTDIKNYAYFACVTSFMYKIYTGFDKNNH